MFLYVVFADSVTPLAVVSAKSAAALAAAFIESAAGLADRLPAMAVVLAGDGMTWDT